MSPAEKAKELYDKFDEAIPPLYDYDAVRPVVLKTCALICVKEVQESDACDYQHADDFWRSVKEEIEKL